MPCEEPLLISTYRSKRDFTCHTCDATSAGDRKGSELEASQSFARAILHNPCFKEAYINNDALLLKLGSLKGTAQSYSPNISRSYAKVMRMRLPYLVVLEGVSDGPLYKCRSSHGPP